jgi:membrane glycosyltransferase
VKRLVVYRIDISPSGRPEWGVWCKEHRQAHGFFDTRQAARDHIANGNAAEFCRRFGALTPAR